MTTAQWQHPLVTSIRGHLRRQEYAANRVLQVVGAGAEAAPSTTKRVAMFALASVATDRRIVDIHRPGAGEKGRFCQACATSDELGRVPDQPDLWPCATLLAVAAKLELQP